VLNNLVYSSKKVLADLESGLVAFGPVKPRQVAEAGARAYRNAIPYRGVGVHPDGQVTLAVYDKIVVAKDLKGQLPLAVLGASTLDSVHLNGADWSSFAPVKIAPGNTWTLPQATARKFFPLLGIGDTRFLPEEVTGAQFTGQVQEVKGGIAYLTYRGSIAGTHQGPRQGRPARDRRRRWAESASSTSKPGKCSRSRWFLVANHAVLLIAPARQEGTGR
jgi:hypothetical protein